MKLETVKTVRTTIQALIGLLPVLPVLLPALGVATTAGVGASVLAVAAALTRLMQVDAVEDLLRRFGISTGPTDSV